MLLAGTAAVVLGGWFTATAVIAGHGWYHHAAWPRGAVAADRGGPGFFGALLALRRIPVVSRALAAPGLASRLEYPHTFRVEGVAFLIMMALGHLPALFALPAGLGDIAAGIAAPLVAYRLARGTGRRAARWHNAFGMTDLVVALTLGALTGFRADQRHAVRRTDLRAPARADRDSRRAAAARLAHHVHVHAGQSPADAAADHQPAHCRREVAENRMQLEIDALKRGVRLALAAGQRTLVVLASQLMAAEPRQQGHPPARLYAGRGPGQRKGNAMNTRSPYPDVEVPEISLPRFILDRADERGAGGPTHGSRRPR